MQIPWYCWDMYSFGYVTVRGSHCYLPRHLRSISAAKRLLEPYLRLSSEARLRHWVAPHLCACLLELYPTPKDRQLAMLYIKRSRCLELCVPRRLPRTIDAARSASPTFHLVAVLSTMPSIPDLRSETCTASSTIMGPGSQTRLEGVNAEAHPEEYGPQPGEKSIEDFEIKIALDDPDHPQSWSRVYRWYITAVAGLLVLNGTFASSAPSGVLPELIEHFTFSQEVGTLTISLFVGGYCVGPLLWGPLSEQFGRRPIFILTFTCYTAFQVGCALSPNTGSILIFRFLGGTFAAAPLSNSGALISDIWDANTRGKALAVFTLAPFAGPSLGPIVSGFMGVAGVSWRWLFWVLTMFAGLCLAVIVLTVPETYLPVLLVKKAQRRRKETGDDRWWAPMENQKLAFVQHAKRVLARPFLVLFQEPMLIAITIYMSFVYGCLYLLFEAFPIVFTEAYGFNAGISGLMFLPIFLGGAAGVILYLLIFNPIYERKLALMAPNPVPPEARLDIAMWAGPIYAISYFWFAWTSFPTVSYWAPLIAIFPMGIAIEGIFLALFNYIIDTYLFAAASALSATTVARSIFGASFPLFATQMYDKLNPRWASSLLGFLALLMAPIPFVLFKYGPMLRNRSKFSPTKDLPVKKAAAGDV